MRDSRRALSSVADVSLALVLVVAAIGVFVGFTGTPSPDHDPLRTTHTADTLGPSTLAVSYSLAPLLETESEAVDSPGDDAPYEDADLRRTSHGPAIGHVARAALGNTQFRTGAETPSRPLGVGPGFAASLEETLAVRLVASQFRTNISAVWEPFDRSSVRGTATVGPRIPIDAETTLVRVAAASEFPNARERAVEAVRSASNDSTHPFRPVARVVADAIINHTFATAQRAIERGGVDRAIIVSRYLRFADALPAVDRTYDAVDGDFSRSHANTEAMNGLLRGQLTKRFEATLEANYDTPLTAATAVSTGDVTVSITTWNP